MKNQFYLLILCCITNLGSTQNCLPAGHNFTSQQDITDFSLNYPGCVNIQGTLIISGSGITDLTGLSQLLAIDGALVIDQCVNLNDLTGLQGLTAVPGDLVLEGNNGLVSLTGLDNISSVGGSLNIINNSSLQDFMGLGNLNFVGQSIAISDNDALLSFTGLNGPGFENLYIYNNDNLQSTFGIGASQVIGDLVLEANGNLQDISSFQSLASVGGICYILDNELSNLDDLSFFNSIGGAFHLSGQFNQINGLQQLNSIGGELSIIHTELVDLSGLDNLMTIGGQINIANNLQLTSLSGIQNIDPATIQSQQVGLADINIKDNPLLSQCAVESICEALVLPGISTDIINNSTGCATEADIDCINIGISGTVFYDVNQNSIQDANEVTIPNIPIEFSPPTQNVLSNQNGFFYQVGQPGVNTISFLFDPNWIVTTGVGTYSINFTPGNPANINNNFGLIPAAPFHGGKVNLSSNPTRCNTDVGFSLRVQNLGSFTESGQVQLHYDPNTVFVSANPAPDIIDVNSHTLTWNISSLLAFQFQDYDLVFSMPNENSTGAPLNFISDLFFDDGSMLVLADNQVYSAVVLCAYDPNDKLVLPPGEAEEHYTLHDEKLTYTVRFQNTGNAEAINVAILDTLDVDLDVSTFRVLNSSFPVQTSIRGQALEFYFANINLPDSLSNEPGSHGFITYEINPVAGLADFTTIENTAYIIFDFNPAIITNTSLNTMVTMIPTSTFDLKNNFISVHPNPTKGICYIQNTGNQSILQVLIYNRLGQLVFSTQQNLFDITQLPDGLYFINVEIADKLLTKKLIVLH